MKDVYFALLLKQNLEDYYWYIKANYPNLTSFLQKLSISVIYPKINSLYIFIIVNIIKNLYLSLYLLYTIYSQYIFFKNSYFLVLFLFFCDYLFFDEYIIVQKKRLSHFKKALLF